MSTALIEWRPLSELTFYEQMMLRGALQCGETGYPFFHKMVLVAITRRLHLPYSLASNPHDGSYNYFSGRLDYVNYTGDHAMPAPTPKPTRVHCPACGDSQIPGPGQTIFRCEKCGGMFDSEADEGGDYDDRDPSRRMQRQEAQREYERRRRARR